MGFVKCHMSFANDGVFEVFGSGDSFFLYFHRILANFFMFIQAKVSPTFMVIFSLPIC